MVGFQLPKPRDELVLLILWSIYDMTGPTIHPHISGAVAAGQTTYLRALNTLDFLFINS